ncbi:hypothetical protein [Zoogloea sp.]|uniref:hypothetical protein n=1 Tax=Zoogloea sp. TaxID=49181 RepID=UPI00321F91E4
MRAIALVVFFAVLGALSGCSTYGQHIHLEEAGRTAASTIDKSNPDLGKLVLLREMPALAKLSLQPWPLIGVAVDHKMVSIMPLDSHINLDIPPGRRTISWVAINQGVLSKTKELSVNVLAGQPTYVSLNHGLLSWELEPMKAEEAAPLSVRLPKAKVLPNGVRLDEFVKRMGGAKTLGDQLRAALPSREAIESAIAGVGTIALFAVLFAGALAGADLDTFEPPQPSTFSPNAVPHQALSRSVPRDDRFGIGENQSLGDLLRDGRRIEMRDSQTGVRYIIENGRVNGTDGSRMRLIGSTLYSDTGASYQVIGNSVYGSDGTSCQRVGNRTRCK